MIFPKPECSPFGAVDEFDERVMIEYIKTNFADFLGEDVKLLDLPNGLDLIQAKYPLRAALRTARSTHPIAQASEHITTLETRPVAVA